MKNIPPLILNFAEEVAENPEKGFSTASFLQKTEQLPLPPTERLRLLGIALETEYIDPLARHWQLLDQTYAAALQLAPDHPFILQSRGISATEISLLEAVPAELKAKLFAIAREAFEAALKIAPAEGDIWYTLGNLYYFHGHIEAALQSYQEALHCLPAHYLAQMYLGHCYFDQGAWEKAYRAFQKVDRASLQARQPRWRNIKLAELMGICLVKLGREKEAEPLFDEVLDAYQQPEKAELADPLEMKQLLSKIRWPRWLSELP
jgi:tetratricopeptide (TPR) repeat protein